MFKKLNLNKRKIIIISAAALLGLVIYLTVSTSIDVGDDAVELFSTSPSNGVEDVSQDTTVDIVFLNSLSNKEKDLVEIKVEPSVEFNESWLTDKQLRINPLSKLRYDTNYVVTVFYDSEVLTSFTFTVEQDPDLVDVVSEIELTEEDEQVLLEDAFSVQESLNEIEQQAPWYFDLPIKKDNYVVIYNTERGEFRISLYISENSPQSEIDNTINSALSDLDSIGVNMENYNYYTIFR